MFPPVAFFWQMLLNKSTAMIFVFEFFIYGKKVISYPKVLPPTWQLQRHGKSLHANKANMIFTFRSSENLAQSTSIKETEGNTLPQRVALLAGGLLRLVVLLMKPICDAAWSVMSVHNHSVAYDLGADQRITGAGRSENSLRRVTQSHDLLDRYGGVVSLANLT